MSDRYRNPRVRQHLDVFARSLRKGDAVPDEFRDNHALDFVDMLEGILLRVALRGSAAPFQRRTVSVPAIVIPLRQHFKTASLHAGASCSSSERRTWLIWLTSCAAIWRARSSTVMRPRSACMP